MCSQYQDNFVLMDDEHHLRSMSIEKPTKELLEKMETEVWVRSQQDLKYVPDGGDSVRSHVTCITDTLDKPMFCVISSTHSEHSNESLTPLDLNSKHGYSKVRTDEMPSQHPESRQSRISSMPYEFNHCRVPFEQAEHVMPKSDQLDAPSCYSKCPRMPDGFPYYVGQPARSIRLNMSREMSQQSCCGRSQYSKISSLQRQAAKIEEALLHQQLEEEKDNLLEMERKEEGRIAQRKHEEEILKIKREEEDRQARLQYELDLHRKRNDIKRRDLEMSLFQTRVELSESMKECEEMQLPTFEQPCRNDAASTFQHQDERTTGENQRPYSATIPPPIHGPQLLNGETQHAQGEHLMQTDQIAKIFADSINISRLPVPQPEVFTGNPLKFNSWMSSFSILIESKGLLSHEKIHYLKQYLGGEAKQTIETLDCLGDTDIYSKAKTLLQRRYGSSFVISEAYREKIANWPKIHTKDGTSLRRLGDFLEQCLIAKSSVKGLQILDDCRENRKILEKLPANLVERWSRHIYDYDEYPNFQTFVRFIVKEADILCNPITNLKLLKSDDMKGTQGFSFACGSKDISDSSPTQCVYCGKRYHSIIDCHRFTRKSSNERTEFITKNGLCYGCLKKGHLSRDCPKRSLCEKCHRHHPSCLHDDYDKRYTEVRSIHKDDSYSDSSTGCTDHGDKDI